MTKRIRQLIEARKHAEPANVTSSRPTWAVRKGWMTRDAYMRLCRSERTVLAKVATRLATSFQRGYEAIGDDSDLQSSARAWRLSESLTPCIPTKVAPSDRRTEIEQVRQRLNSQRKRKGRKAKSFLKADIRWLFEQANCDQEIFPLFVLVEMMEMLSLRTFASLQPKLPRSWDSPEEARGISPKKQIDWYEERKRLTKKVPKMYDSLKVRPREALDALRGVQLSRSMHESMTTLSPKDLDKFRQIAKWIERPGLSLRVLKQPKRRTFHKKTLIAIFKEVANHLDGLPPQVIIMAVELFEKPEYNGMLTNNEARDKLRLAAESQKL